MAPREKSKKSGSFCYVRKIFHPYSIFCEDVGSHTRVTLLNSHNILYSLLIQGKLIRLYIMYGIKIDKINE